MRFNYELLPYRAVCFQWDGTNAEVICKFIDNALVFREKYIVIRHKDGVNTLNIGDWVIKGEDGEIRFYTKELFQLKYRPI